MREASALRATPPDLAAILALDLATATGWAYRVDGKLESGVQDFTLKRGESPGMRYVNFNRWLREVCPPLLDTLAAGHLGLIAYEQAHHRGGAATEVLVGLTTRVQEYCARWQINHVAVHTATLKRFATQKGNASKAEMLAAVNGRWRWRIDAPPITNDNEADAVALLHYVETIVLGGGPR